MSWRKLGVLLRHLPAEAALIRELHPATSWSATDYLLAHIADLQAVANWQRANGKGPRPKPISRPGQSKGKAMGTARPIAEMRRILDTWGE